MSASLMVLALATIGLARCSTLDCANSSAIPQKCTYLDAYKYQMEDATSFPNKGTKNAGSVPVGVNVILMEISDISPDTMSWTGRFQVDMFWPNVSCAYSVGTADACNDRLGTFYFATPQHTTSETTYASLTSEMFKADLGTAERDYNLFKLEF